MTGPVSVSRNDGVALVRIDAPERMNALNIEIRQALASAFEELTADSEIRVLVVSGGPTVFAAGADLRMLAERNPREVAELRLGDYWQPITDCPKPVIAAVSGLALGAGCELALMCDVIVADPTAQFGQPESRVGIMPGAGGSQRLVRVLGKYLASYLLMGAGTLDAARAHALGLVVELSPEGEAERLALDIARRLSCQPPLALAAIKRSLALGADLPLPAANAIENREFLLLFDTHDQKEGMAAFLEKRKPDFEGR